MKEEENISDINNSILSQDISSLDEDIHENISTHLPYENFDLYKTKVISSEKKTLNYEKIYKEDQNLLKKFNPIEKNKINLKNYSTEDTLRNNNFNYVELGNSFVEEDESQNEYFYSFDKNKKYTNINNKKFHYKKSSSTKIEYSENENSQIESKKPKRNDNK